MNNIKLAYIFFTYDVDNNRRVGEDIMHLTLGVINATHDQYINFIYDADTVFITNAVDYKVAEMSYYKDEAVKRITFDMDINDFDKMPKLIKDIKERYNYEQNKEDMENGRTE